MTMMMTKSSHSLEKTSQSSHNLLDSLLTMKRLTWHWERRPQLLAS